MDGVLNGNSTVGTISVIDNNDATYAAPADLGSLTGVTIEVRLVANPAVTATVPVTLTNIRWQPISAGLTSLDVETITPAPDGSAIYAGTSNGKVFRSADGGATWQDASGTVGAALPGIFISALAVDPTNSDIVYAGTTTSGIFKSTDAGATWSAINNRGDSTFFSLPSALVLEIAIDPTNTQRLFAAFNSGTNFIDPGKRPLFRSTDGGQNWFTIGPGVLGNGFAMDLNNPATLYLAAGNVLYRSTDGGDSFTTPFSAVLSGFNARDVWVDPFDSNHVVHHAEPVGRPRVLLETRDGGTTWTQATTGLPSTNSYDLAFSPDIQGTVLVGLSPQRGPFISTSTTSTSWHDVSTGLQAGLATLQTQAVTIAPTTSTFPDAFYVGTPNGVYRTAPTQAQSPANLVIETISTAPTTVSQGQTGISVSMTVDNTGQATANINSSSLTFIGTADRTSEYTLISSGGNPTTIAGGATATFNFIVTVSASATTELITIDGTVSGTDANTGAALSDSTAVTTDSWIVQTPPNFVYQSGTLSPTSATQGQGITLSVQVNNTGQAGANLTTATAATFTDGTRTFTANLASATAIAGGAANVTLTFSAATVDGAFTPDSYTVTVNLTGTDTNGNAYSQSITSSPDQIVVGAATIAILGPRDLKFDAIAELEAVKAAIEGDAPGVGDAEDASEEIDNAIRRINRSLERRLWAHLPSGEVDQLRLNQGKGNKVFHEEMHATKDIFDAIDDGEITNPAIRNELLTVINKLLNADRLLALVAIQDAEADPDADPKKLAKAREKLAEGDQLVEDAAAEADLEERTDLIGDAIDRGYREAWKAAANALLR